MQPDAFDRLSKTMGGAQTRRGLLRVFIAGVAATAFGSLGAVSQGDAATAACGAGTGCTSGHHYIRGTCYVCGGPGQVCCGGTRCHESYALCISGTCRSCGYRNQGCCGVRCFQGGCASGTCR
jgi:hypothetical protein